MYTGIEKLILLFFFTSTNQIAIELWKFNNPGQWGHLIFRPKKMITNASNNVEMLQHH